MNPAAKALRYFGLKQTLKSAIFFGVFVGLLALVQGFGYGATYPDAIDREKFALTMGSAPSLGILYGEPDGLLTPSGYMVYRAVAFMAFIGSIWMLLAATKILRGAEEDGRLEPLISGSVSLRQTTFHLLSGVYVSLFIGYLISSGIVAIGGLAPMLNVSILDSLLINAAIFLPAGFGAALGSVASQLTITRRRSVMYGLGILAVAFILRSIGNVLPDWYWLKNVTPFGWSDQLRPLLDLQPIWLLPLIASPIALIAAGTYLAGIRDYGESLLPESVHTKSRYHLLKSPWQLALRLNLGVLVSWTALIVVLGAIVASVATVATNAVAESDNLSQSITALTGGDNTKLKEAFIGAGALFTALTLMIMATVGMGAIRREESKQHLETILVQPVGRARWLVTRLAVIIVAVTVACVVSNIAVLLVAKAQDITLEPMMIVDNMQMLGAVIFTIGIGAACYGFLPKTTTLFMYFVLIWSFGVDLIGSVISLSDLVTNSSLFHYISFVPAVEPNWTNFTVLATIGFILMAIGVWQFTRRDYALE